MDRQQSLQWGVYIQKVRGWRKDEIAVNLRSGYGSENTETPEYQVGAGCLVDQLMGQYLADICGLGPLVSQDHIRKTIASIHRFNSKHSMADRDNIARTYVLNDEAAEWSMTMGWPSARMFRFRTTQKRGRDWNTFLHR